MKNVLRTLIYNGQVSLTVADTTALVQEGIRLHGLTKTSALVFGKALSTMTFMSAALKGETGEVSLSVKTEGRGGEIAVSGNSKLYMRGYITDPCVPDTETEESCFGKIGSLTVIRDDGYSRPFVGSCALPGDGDVDSAFEEYYHISEQLPTRIRTAVETDENGNCVFAGVIVMQMLPFADAATFEKVGNACMEDILNEIRDKGVESAARDNFPVDETVWEEREAIYKRNCSKEYLTEVLTSLGEAQMRQIIREDGAVRVHCHYCNTDYEFTDEDADRMFPRA